MADDHREIPDNRTLCQFIESKGNFLHECLFFFLNPRILKYVSNNCSFEPFPFQRNVLLKSRRDYRIKHTVIFITLWMLIAYITFYTFGDKSIFPCSVFSKTFSVSAMFTNFLFNLFLHMSFVLESLYDFIKSYFLINITQSFLNFFAVWFFWEPNIYRNLIFADINFDFKWFLPTFPPKAVFVFS